MGHLVQNVLWCANCVWWRDRWVGIAAITVYAPTIFAEAGYSSRKSQWMSGLNDVCNIARFGTGSWTDILVLLQITYMLSTLMAVVTIDRWGRRIGLYWGAIAQGIALILAGAFARLLKDHPEKAAQYGGAAAFFVFMYTAVFGATWLTIPWVCSFSFLPWRCHNTAENGKVHSASSERRDAD